MSESSSAATLPATLSLVSLLSDDLLLNILVRLEADPRDWARLACVSTRLAALVRNVCCRSKCSRSFPSLVSDLAAGEVPGVWAALLKLSVCCPGLLHAGVLLENSDFGLEREIGPDDSFRPRRTPPLSTIPSATAATATAIAIPTPSSSETTPPPASNSAWSLFDDLYLDAVYDVSESQIPAADSASNQIAIQVGHEAPRKRKRHCGGPVAAHLAAGVWNLSREQGNKLLASRFRGDCLYICDWPGCVHAEEKRNYMLFRGVFKDFKRSRVWRTINDGNRGKIDLHCAFCACKQTWDLHSAFCLRRVFGFHDDGEPVVRAYVCENGHVSGAWTERPMYS